MTFTRNDLTKQKKTNDMKLFLMNHETFIEDLQKASVIVSKYDRELAGVISKYIGEIIDFDDQTGFVDMGRKDRSIFRLECGERKSSWKKWQQLAFEEAREHDGKLFTNFGISVLIGRMQSAANMAKNVGEVRGPDWAFCDEYGVSPTISVGEGCTIRFEPVKGYFMAIQK